MQQGSPASTENQQSAAEITKRARAAFLWVGSTTAVWQIATWIFTLYTARVLSPSDYGLIALAETVNPYLALLAALNIPTWMIQVKHFPEKDQRSILSLCLISGAFMTGVSLLAAPLVAQFYGNPSVKFPIQVMSITFLLRGLAAVPDSLLRREMRFTAISIMNVTLGLTRGALQLLLALRGYGYWALVAGVVFKEAAECVWLISLRGLPRRLGWDNALFARALGFGVPATFATICWIVYSSADAIFVGKMFGAGMLGIYSMALALIDMPLSKLNSVIWPILFPYFSRLFHIPGALEPSFLKVVRLITGITFPMMLGLAAISDELIPLVLGPHWAPMATTMRILCVVGLLKAFTDNLTVLFLSIGKPQLVLYFNILGMCTLPLGFLGLGTLLGMKGIYAAWLILLPLLCFVNLNILKRVTGITPLRFVLNSRAPFIAAMLMLGSIIGLNNLLDGAVSPWAVLSSELLVGALTYFAVLYLVFPHDLKELIRSKKEFSAPS